MAGFWENIKNLVLQTELSNPQNPAVHEVINPSDYDLSDYLNWKSTIVCSNFFSWLNQQYSHYLLDTPFSPSITFLNKTPSFGFMIHFSEMGYSKRDAIYISLLLKDKTLNLKYRLQIADRKIYYLKNIGMEITERHYLKPKKIVKPDEKIEQYYGNITIELLLRNDLPFQLTYRATSYPDRIYAPGLPFSQLMEKLLMNPLDGTPE
jgi:hypothetical protein